MSTTGIVSKNLYELLGNDQELDPDRAPEPPTKVVDKPAARAGKRNVGPEGAAKDAPRAAGAGRGGRNDAQARGDGAVSNRDDGVRSDRHPRGAREPREYRGDGRGRGRGRGFGGRGGRGGAPRDDRHSHTGIGEHDKQAAHGWGAEQDGNAELADEQAGDAIASAEAKNDAGFTPDTAGADPAFTNGPDGETGADEAALEEDKTKSYDQYLADLAEKRLALGDKSLDVRKPNEGSSQKFPEGKAFSRDPGEENFMVGAGGKARKAKDTQDKKERVNLEGSYYAPVDSGDRGRGGRGRGRGRGGDFRGGDRGRGGERRGGGRGDSRGGARGDRGGPRGGPRGGFNANDSSAFPALGA